MDKLGIQKSPVKGRKNVVGDFQIKQLSQIQECDENHESFAQSPDKQIESFADEEIQSQSIVSERQIQINDYKSYDMEAR